MKNPMEYNGYFGSVIITMTIRFSTENWSSFALLSAMRERTLFHCERLSRKPLTIILNSVKRQASNLKNPSKAPSIFAIPGFQGVWANMTTVEECRQELVEVLEEWLILKIRDRDSIPIIEGVAAA